MKITMELSIRDFKAWAGALDTQEKIISAGMAEEFDNLIEELYPDGIDVTHLNDILWFDGDWILSTLGIELSTEEIFEVLEELETEE